MAAFLVVGIDRIVFFGSLGDWSDLGRDGDFFWGGNWRIRDRHNVAMIGAGEPCRYGVLPVARPCLADTKKPASLGGLVGWLRRF
jgi:hypothetical protein